MFDFAENRYADSAKFKHLNDVTDSVCLRKYVVFLWPINCSIDEAFPHL